MRSWKEDVRPSLTLFQDEINPNETELLTKKSIYPSIYLLKISKIYEV